MCYFNFTVSISLKLCSLNILVMLHVLKQLFFIVCKQLPQCPSTTWDSGLSQRKVDNRLKECGEMSSWWSKISQWDSSNDACHATMTHTYTLTNQHVMIILFGIDFTWLVVVCWLVLDSLDLKGLRVSGDPPPVSQNWKRLLDETRNVQLTLTQHF